MIDRFYLVKWKSLSGKNLQVYIENSKLASFVELFLIKGIVVSISKN
jgi:hypothetical protein